MSPETIECYKFTSEDIAFLREPFERCNACIIAEVREQYDKLAAIDGLHGPEG